MTVRRDFLAFTAGAVAAKTVLPFGARAETIQDRDLMARCAAFCQAQADWDTANATPGWDDKAINALSERWEAALKSVLACAPPTTPSERVALARAALIALRITVDDLGPGGWEANAGPEHYLILMALSSTAGSAMA
jgi:hypothetical protein